MPEGRARRIAGHCGRVALGLVFLLAGILKALDPAEFARQIAGYGLVGESIAAAGAPLLIALEIGLGAALLLGAFPVAAAAAGCCLLAAFIAIEAYGLMHGRTEACGCFGAYVQRTPGQVIVEDLLFVGFGILAVWGLAAWRGLARRAAFAAVVLAGAAGLALPLASPHLPLDRLLTRLAPGRSLDELGIRAHLPSLSEGRRLIALIDVTDPAAA
ncbi:MAG: MauE/DoxX family redox-associated membrane protein, partial [Candidatus Polarisedimenticolia bacterium]